MLAKLRSLEKKMGLVLTLVGRPLFPRRVWLTTCVCCLCFQFKASVWGVINEQPEPPSQYTDSNDMTVRQ